MPRRDRRPLLTLTVMLDLRSMFGFLKSFPVLDNDTRLLFCYTIHHSCSYNFKVWLASRPSAAAVLTGLHRLLNHERQQGQTHLRSRQDGRLPWVIVDRSDFHNVGAHNHQPRKSVQNRQELTARPAAGLCGASSCSISNVISKVDSSWRPGVEGLITHQGRTLDRAHRYPRICKHSSLLLAP